MDNYLSRQDTKAMKAIAVILMIIHHLWTFPDRIAGGGLKFKFFIFDNPSITYIGAFGKICVSLFFFLGGYGLYLSNKDKKFDLIDRIRKLYSSYWKVLFIFIPIAFIFFSNQPIYTIEESITNRYNNGFHLYDFLLNITGVNTSYNYEWWFLLQYIFMLFLFPLMKKITDKCSTSVNIFIVIVYAIFTYSIAPAIGNIIQLGNLNNDTLYQIFFRPVAPYTACFWMGIVCAKSGLLNRIYDSLKNKLNPVTDMLFIVLVVFLRQTAFDFSIDIFLVPLFIVVCIDLIKRLKHIYSLFAHIGSQSVNMWLIHSFFCYYFYGIVKIVVAPKWAVPSLLILLVLTYVASIAVTYFWKGISVMWEKIRIKKKSNS